MTESAHLPLRLDSSGLAPEGVEALLARSIEGVVPAAVIDVSGSGAVACLQGILTCDVESSGEHAFLYGAVLTRFGMIRSDCWVARHGADLRLVVPAAGVEPINEVLDRSLPPRLARATEVTDAVVIRVVGPRAFETAARAGLEEPAPGTVTQLGTDADPIELARPPAAGPFQLQFVLRGDAAPGMRERLRSAGAREARPELLELARVLAGWPALGHEIDQKTLPQEVRFDEIGGVSYTKGCYVGQETIARVHFRGHPNRHLEGLLFADTPTRQVAVLVGAKEVGRVTAQVWLASRRRWLGLAVVRREVEPGASVVASEVEATVVPLPFAPEII